MEKSITTTIIVAAVTAIVASLITASFYSNVALSPWFASNQVQTIGGVATNSKACNADDFCETRGLLVTDDAQFQDSADFQLDIRTNMLKASGIAELNGGLLVGDDFLFEDSGRFGLGFASDGDVLINKHLYLVRNELNHTSFPQGVASSIYVEGDVVAGAGIGSMQMAGTGDAYACVNRNGGIFRSQTPCA